jgi:hypothetical protein
MLSCSLQHSSHGTSQEGARRLPQRVKVSGCRRLGLGQAGTPRLLPTGLLQLFCLGREGCELHVDMSTTNCSGIAHQQKATALAAAVSC